MNSTLEHGLLSTAIGQAAEISRREGKTVYIKELIYNELLELERDVLPAKWYTP